MMLNRRTLALSLAILALAGCHNHDNGFHNGQAASSAASAVPATTPTDDAAAAGRAFLADNARQQGVHTTASGLQYRVRQAGNGAKPGATDVVSVTYTGRLIDGTVFDSTDKHGGEPISFPLNQVIAGWTEGLQLMQEGAEYTFYIPAELAYGAHGSPGAIPPHSTLIFDVKLIKVNP